MAAHMRWAYCAHNMYKPQRDPCTQLPNMTTSSQKPHTTDVRSDFSRHEGEAPTFAEIVRGRAYLLALRTDSPHPRSMPRSSEPSTPARPLLGSWGAVCSHFPRLLRSTELVMKIPTLSPPARVRPHR